MGSKHIVPNKKRLAHRFFPLMLACVLLLSAAGTAALAANGTKGASRAIAIVYDNSGSMYVNQNMAWCRAMYAIEVFASMMNEGDTLQVYPMYELTAGGRSYTSQDPVTVSGGGDISVIRELFTPRAGDTPIETIGDAFSGLQKTSADEKWLIVLTDGDEFYENEQPLGSNTKTRLSEVLTQYNQNVNVLYLGIDRVAVMPEVTGESSYLYYADKASNSADVLSKLTEMCNMIFGRDELVSSGSQMTFDVSMKKLILFVQGSDISNVTLKNASGASVGRPTIEYAPRYSEQGAGAGIGQNGFGVDQSLSGYIAIYDLALDAGTYSLGYTGNASNVSVYYEPDIDLSVTLTDAYGTVADASSPLYPGEYTIQYGLVDKSGSLTSSSLLGQTSYKVTYSINGEERTVNSSEGGQIPLELNEGDTLDGRITVTYLSGYTITKDASDFGWPIGGFQVVPRPAGFLEVRLSGTQETYPLSQLESARCDVVLYFEGAPLTGEQLDAAELAVTVEGGSVGYDLSQQDGGYTLSLRHAGAPEDTACGAYTLHVSASYTDEFGATAQSEVVSVPFTIEDDGFQLDLQADGAGYFVISKLEESEGIRVVLSADGAPLSDEQLSHTTLNIEADGLTCESEPLPGQSAFAVRILPDNNAVPGRYTLRFTAVSQDQIGREISAQDSKKIELSTYPLWLRILVICLIILLLIALVLLYLSRKILPKKIGLYTAQTVFIVDGETIPGAAKCTFSGGKKKRGSIQVQTPAYSGSPLVKGGFTLTLEAVSPRRVKSSRRRALVTKISPANTTALTSLTVGTHTLSKTDEGDGVVWLLDGKQVPGAAAAASFEIGGKPSCTYTGETITGEAFTLTVQLQFK